MSGFDEDVYARETEAMDTAMLQGLHQPMKKWFSTQEAQPLKDAVGAFPSFWQELGSWEHMWLAKKIYMAVTDLRAAGEADSIDIQAMVNKALGKDKGVLAEAKTTEMREEEQGATQERKRRRKKKSRWGDEPAAEGSVPAASGSVSSTSATVGASGAGEGSDTARGQVTTDMAIAALTDRGRPRTRASSLWSRKDAIAETFRDEAKKGGLLGVDVGPVKLTAAQEQQFLVLQMQLQLIPAKLERVPYEYKLLLDNPERARSPSPPPTYDTNGVRTNKRDQRMRDKLLKEQVRLVEELEKIDPNYIPPTNIKREKPVRKIKIPVDAFPNYNFIGLILGPRGSTQKDMEGKTNTKIAIRGKGSVKDGGKSSRKDITREQDQEPLHVR